MVLKRKQKGHFYSRTITVLIFLLVSITYSHSQGNQELAKIYLNEKYPSLSSSSANDWILTNEVFTKHNGITNVYLRQTYNGIEIWNANVNVLVKDGKVIHHVGSAITKLGSSINTNSTLTPIQAVQFAANDLGLSITEPLTEIAISDSKSSARQSGNEKLISKGGISLESIPVKKMYWADKKNNLHLCWDLSVYELSKKNWWSIRVDALTGEIIDKNNWVTECKFENNQSNQVISNQLVHTNTDVKLKTQSISDNSQYRVFPFPYESPLSGPRQLIASPADSLASPYGWHDTNGVDGAEYTITRGNNVYSYEDSSANETPGYSADGGANLVFDFPLDAQNTPANNLDAGITNLFYDNNIVHDIFYHYGFDEASGNFQTNNYNRGGKDQDPVKAEAQDGLGLNNANFSTPPDGLSPRMQMYLWTPFGSFQVNQPSSIAGEYINGYASFGPSISQGITGVLAMADDGQATSTDGCSALINDVTGKIVVIDRGNCTFKSKVLRAQNAGAIAVIIIDNKPSGSPLALGDDPTTTSTITIPVISIMQTDGITIKNELLYNASLNGTIHPIPPLRDACFDNAIIAHEYGHGISNRLTGGPANTSCLTNGEQMGEGWSDYFALMLTMNNGDTGTSARAIGNYDIGLSQNGSGIRPAPYSTDMSVNGYTYDDVKAIGPEVHNVGFIWATMLWDLNWALINKYGFDSDIKNGHGGNNIGLQLVIDGLKLQPCGPGFVDGRDAILLADQINNGGVNRYLIWSVFARRGLGASANQGDSYLTDDGVAAFDMPHDLQLSFNVDHSFISRQNITYTVNAKNISPLPLSGVSITHELPAGLQFISASAGGSFSNGTISYGGISLQSQEEKVFTFQVKPDYTNSTDVLFADDAEQGTGLWNLSSVIGNNPWQLSGDFPNTGAFSWYAKDIALQSEQNLTLKNSISVKPGMKLAFYHAFSTEASFDGGVVESSIDNGASWQDLGTRMIQNGYNGLIDQFSGTSISTRKSFTGYQGTYQKTLIDLNSFVGKNLLVRFRWVNDNGNSAYGWVIDNIYFFAGNEYEITSSVCGGSSLFGSSCEDATVLLMNSKPIINQTIPDQEARQLIPFTFQVNNQTFKDQDDDALVYSASLTNGSLPLWLSFDPSTMTFSGTPAKGDGTVTLRVTATDPMGAYAFDDFVLHVDVITAIEPGNQNSFKAYPNPTQGKLYLAGLNEAKTIMVISSIGQTLFSLSSNQEISELDLSSLASGLYFIEVQSTDVNTRLKIIKQ